MSTPRNITCRFVVTCCLTIAALATATTGRADTPARPDSPESRADDAPAPAAHDVVAAYMTLRTWVTSFDPPPPDAPPASITVEGMTGAAVILRHRGRVLASTSASGNDARLLRRLTGRALSAVLGDPTVKRLPPDTQARVGNGLTLELECAGPLIPLPGRSFARIAEQLEPGLDGVAMRRGDSIHMLFPSRLRATNSAGTVARLLPSMAVELGLPARDLETLSRTAGVRLYRFRTIHLAQRAPGRRPFPPYRGQVLYPRSRVSAESITDLIDGLTDHIITSLWRRDEPIGLMGTYRPLLDQYEPLAAPPVQQAVTAFALARAAQVASLDAAMTEASMPDRLRGAANVLVEDLASVVGPEADPLDDPVACAAIIHAVRAVPQSRITPAVDTMYRTAMTNVITAFADESLMAGHDGALIAAAGAQLLDEPDAPMLPHLVRAQLDRVWASIPGPQQISLLPWIGWAELDYARATGASLNAADRLRAMRQTLHATRIGAGALDGPEDLHGGFALRRRGSASQADAQTARPAAFLATMLRHPELTTPEERPAATTAHLDTMRFLHQLVVDDSLMWAIPTPQRARGGVRASTWDLSLPTGAQALTLLAAAETLSSLAERRVNEPAGR